MFDEELDTITIQHILEERAQALTQIQETTNTTSQVGLVVLQLGKEKYGVPIKYVQEIRPRGELTRVPGTPTFYAGLVNLRGHLYPVLDLQRYLNLPEPADGKTKIILVAAAGLEICILVDDVLDIQWVAESEIKSLLIEEASTQRDFITGVTTDLLSMLDLDTLLSDPQLIIQDQVV